jgi:hypothetical protein
MIQDIANKVKTKPVIRVIFNKVNADNYVRFLGMPLMEEFLESKFSLTWYNFTRKEDLISIDAQESSKTSITVEPKLIK